MRDVEYFFGTDNFNFDMDSLVPGLLQPYHRSPSFSQALQDILDARVYGGMHFPELN